MEAMDDQALVREYARNNSDAAFETLVSRHIRLVYSAALRQTREPHLAEEVTQTVFTILAKKAGKMRGKTILSGWLFKTTRFVALAQSRSAARRRQIEREFHMQAEVQPKTHDPTWDRISPLLDEALMQLSKKDRQAVLLRFFEDRSLAEIGSTFGAREDAARMRITRALEKLHRYFSRRGISSTLEIVAGALSANSVQAVPLGLAKSVSAAAMAKGTAASASIMALSGNALKLMTWTQAKTAILVGAAVLFAGGAGVIALEFIAAARAAHYPKIEGAWEGLMLLDDAGVGPGEAARTHVVLKLSQSNGVYHATTDWIEMGRKDVPMGKAVYDYPSLRLELTPRDSWNLAVNADATQMTLEHAIHFIQPAPVNLRRTTSPDQVPDRLAERDFTPRAGSDLQGYWKGVIDTDPNPLPVELKISESTDGIFRAEGSIEMLGACARPVSVAYTRPSVKLDVATGTGTFEGTINRTNTEISGWWLLDGECTSAVLKRADYRVEHALDQVKNYDFNTKDDLQGHWKGAWVVTFAKVKATIRFALDVAKLPDGSYSARLTNIDEFGRDAPIPASDLQFEPPNVRMKWKWTGTGYEGRLEKGKLVGTWFQGGGAFPLVFERRAAQ